MKTASKIETFAETKKLLAHLHQFSGETMLTFREDTDPGNLYALSLACEDNALVRTVADVLGCPEDEKPEGGGFENSDYWKGEISLRDVADELTSIWGGFFDETVSLFGLRAQVGA
jgi:hypothetical protein